MAGTIFDQAMDKLRDEMAKNPEHPGICAIGEHLTEQLQKNPDMAETILAEGKNLAGAYSALEAHARKRAKGKNGCVVISDQEGFAIAAQYFGIGALETEEKTDAPEIFRAVHQPIGTIDDALDLDALLSNL